MKTRIDLFLVEKNFFDSRSKAQDALKSGMVFCNGKKVDKPAFEIDDTANIEIVGERLKYVSRGGLKLEKALNVFGINLKNMVVMDIGSSTGGFSDCAIQNGAKKIYAVDVGRDCMNTTLKNNPKIILFEETDFRTLDPSGFTDAKLATIDISFISVTKILDKLKKFKNIDKVICLIKPQFECGRIEAKKHKGVVLDKKIHRSVLENVFNAFAEIKFNGCCLTFSPITGGNGNIEYLAYFCKNSPPFFVDFDQIINSAFANF